MRLKIALCALVLALVACGGDDEKTDAGDNGNGGSNTNNNDGSNNGTPMGDGGTCADDLPDLPDNGIAYPDSFCDGDKCEIGGCDPLGRCSPTCNAWQLKADVSFQSARCDDELDLGYPKAPTRTGDEDVCNGTAYMISNPDADVNCCQRGDNEKAKVPLLKLTGLQITQPATFANSVVAGTNKKALESDWYNSIIALDDNEDGDRTATIGNALPNKDGSFFPVAGEFVSNGATFNKKGEWDAQTGVKAVLSSTADGRLLEVGPAASGRTMVLVLWAPPATAEAPPLDYAQLELPIRGIEYSLPLTEDLSCAGERVYGAFKHVGKLTGYLPVDAMRETALHFSKGDDGSNLCTFASSATNCPADVTKWKK